jgi:MFS superfamily sulfate permease-like transporter
VLLIDGESMNDVDATAVITLKEFQGQLLQTGVQIRFARVKNHVMEVMVSGGLKDAVPEEYFYTTVQEAVDAFLIEQEGD